MRRTAALGVLLMPVFAGADEVFLRGGGQLTGEVVERREDRIVVDVGVGQIGFPLAVVERIEPGVTPLALYRERAAGLAHDDAQGWLSLALWAREQERLETPAREAFEHVLSVDPDNVAARRALGHVRLGERWMTEEESYRARGYLRFEGSWVMPEERSAILAERAAEAEEARARVEAEARLREVEARVRIAEAEARRAEAESLRAEMVGPGLPYGVVVGGYWPWFGTRVHAGFHRGFHKGFPMGRPRHHTRFHHGFGRHFHKSLRVHQSRFRHGLRPFFSLPRTGVVPRAGHRLSPGSGRASIFLRPD